MKYIHFNILLLISLLYLMPACRVQKKFNAPVIYTLSENIRPAREDQYVSSKESPLKNEMVRDTVYYIKDSVRLVNDTVHYIIKENISYQNMDTQQTRVSTTVDSSMQKDTVYLPDNRMAADSIARRAYLKRVDSLERKINEILRADSMNKSSGLRDTQINNGDRDSSIVINMASDAGRGSEDSTIAILNKAELRLSQSEEKVKELQQKQQAYRDSASYYRQLAFARSTDADETPKKRKWYQLSSGRNNREAENYSRDSNQQQRYYDAAIVSLENDIENLERNNALLSESYNRLRSNLNTNNNNGLYNTERVVVTRADNGQRAIDDNFSARLMLLQNELNTLRNQPPRETFTNIAKSDTVYMKPAAPQELSESEKKNNSQLDSLRSALIVAQAQINELRNRPLSRPTEISEKRVEEKANSDARSFPIVSIYFMTGSFKVTRDQLPKLVPFTRMAKEDTTASIVLNGFTDGVGKVSSNKILAAKRTRHVQELLVSDYNISDARIEMGEPIIINTSPGKPDPLARRVDLQFK